MGKLAFPTQAQIARLIRAAEAAGMKPTGFKVEPNGAVVVFASEAPWLAFGAASQEDEPNDFDE